MLPSILANAGGLAVIVGIAQPTIIVHKLGKQQPFQKEKWSCECLASEKGVISQLDKNFHSYA